MLVTVVVTSIIVSCSDNPAVDRQLTVAENMMAERPDSALSVLKGIDTELVTSEAEKARYALLMSQALDKNYIDTTTFDVLQPAIDYYIDKDKGTPDEQLRTYYYQGRIYQNLGNQDLAMQSFMRGKEYCQKSSDTLTMANLMVAQATIQYSIYKFDEFINNNLEAANLYKAIGRTDYEILSLANALDGSILNNNKILADSIISIARKRVAKNTELASVIAPYNLSYALKFGNKNEVIDILDYYESVGSIDDIDKLDVVEAYCKIGDASNAKRILYSIPLTSKTCSSLKYLAIKPYVLELNGDFTGALHAYRDFSTTIDSIHMNIFSRDLLFAQERHEMEKTNLMEKQRVDKIIWLSLCIVFVLLIITGYVYYRYRLGKAKNLLETQEKQRLQLEQDNLKRENENLELRSRQVELERHNLQQANEKLDLERHNAVLEKQAAELECERQSLVAENEKTRLQLENDVLLRQNEVLELEKHTAELAAENMRLRISQLETENEQLKDLSDKEDLPDDVRKVIKERVEMLNRLFAARILDKDTNVNAYDEWLRQEISDKERFMNSNRLAFKASHPMFIRYLEEHGLTEYEINYLCLYAIGLKGKDVGNYIQLRRHYNISSEIRSKLGIDEHETNIGIYIRKLLKSL